MILPWFTYNFFDIRNVFDSWIEWQKITNPPYGLSNYPTGE